MKTLRFLILICCSLVLMGSNSEAQQLRSGDQETPARAKSQDKGTEAGPPEAQRDFNLIRQAAESMIRQAAEDATRLDDRRSAVRIQGAAANTLWEIDREYASKLFQRAFEGAINHYREARDSDRVQVTRELSIGRPDFRLEIIGLVSRRDAALGREFMEKYVEEKQRELEERRGLPTGSFDAAFGKVDPAASDFLNIAALLLDTDQKAAFAVAQRAFVTGIPQAAGYFFAQLAAHNRPAADQMYRMAIDRLGQDSAPVPGQLLLLSAYPFGGSQVWIAGGNSVNSYRLEVPKDFTINQQLVHQFIDVSFAVLSRTAGSDVSQFPDGTARLGSALFAARLLEPKIAQFQPARLPDWHAVTMRLLNSAGNKSRDVDQALDEMAKAQETGPSPDAKERIKQLLARAEETADAAKRDDLYRQAAFEADKLGDRTWALEISDEIADADYRKSVRSALNFDAAIRALKEKRFDEAHRLALQVDAIDQQTYVFLELVRAVRKEKDRPNTFLDEAAQRADAAPKTAARLRALLGITYLYASVDSDRSFEIAAEAVRTANKVPTYDSDQARLVRSMETRGANGSSVEVKTVEGFDLSKTLAVLASIDFNRTLGLAQSLESKPLKLATIVAIGASVIEKKQTAKAQ